MPLAQFLHFQRQLQKRYIYLPLSNGMFRQQDVSFESAYVVAGARLAVHKTTATLKGALGPHVNNSVSLRTLHIYSLEISDLKISGCGWGEVASSHSSRVPSTAEISVLVFQQISHWGTGVAKQGVRFISAGEKAEA